MAVAGAEVADADTVTGASEPAGAGHFNGICGKHCLCASCLHNRVRAGFGGLQADLDDIVAVISRRDDVRIGKPEPVTLPPAAFAGARLCNGLERRFGIPCRGPVSWRGLLNSDAGFFFIFAGTERE